MAYYLEFDGVDDYVDLASPISASGDGVLAEIDFVYQGASNDVICGGTSFSDYWRIDKDNQFRISIAGSASILTINTPLVIGERYTLRLVRTGSSVVVEDESGVALTPAANFNANPFIIGKIGSFHNGSSNLAMDLYGFKANNGTNNYNKQTLSGSNDTVLTDTIGGNEGTLVNFPTDNSQWIYDPTIGRIEPTDYYLNGDNEPAHVVVPFEYTPTQSTQVQTLVLTESVLEKMPQAQQDVFWDNVEATGGDLRLTSNLDGTGRLPIEIVSIDTAARKLVIWYRLFEDFDGIGNVYLWFGKVGETQPAVTDPFGRNAVWADYAGMYNLSDGTAIDSSGGNDLTTSGTPSVVSGKIGNATRFDSSADSFNGSFIGLGNTKRTLSLWVNPDDITQNRYLSTFNGGGKSNLTAMLLGFQSGQFNAFDEGYPTGSAVDTQMSATNSTWQHICYSWDGSRLKGYLNGSLVVDVADTLNPATPNFLSITPASGNGSNFYIGNLQYFGARNSGIEPNEIATEYANQSDPAAFYGMPTLATTGGTDPEITAEVSLLFNSIAQNTTYLEYKKYIQALISTNAELETSLSKGQEIAATLWSVADNQLASIKESIVETILIMNSDYNNLAKVSKSAATKLELVDSVSSVATISKILSTQNINSSIDTDLLVKCQKVLSIVVDSIGSTAVQILSDTIKEAVTSIVVSSSADSSVSLLAAKATSIVSLIISTDLLIQSNKQGLTSISTDSKTTTVVVPEKGVSGNINDTHNISTSANTLKDSTVDTEVLASDTDVSNYIEVYKYVPSLVVESAGSNDIIIDVGKQTATFLDSSLANSLEVNINKTLGTITIESNTELLIVTLNNFTDSNIIKIDSSIVMPASISNTTVKTPSRVIDAVIRIK